MFYMNMNSLLIRFPICFSGDRNTLQHMGAKID